MRWHELDPIIRQTNERLGELGIDAGLFDLDDSLIFTSEIFTFFMAEYVSAVVSQSSIGEEVFAKRLRTIKDEAHVRWKVNPSQWQMVVARLAEEFPEAAEPIIQNLPILYKIYLQVPRMIPGARAVLNGLRAGGIKIGIVTHSNEDWAFWKLRVTGLIGCADAVVVANQDGDKASAHYGRGAELLGVPGSRCLVFGDNLKGDIISGMSIGARGMWMPSPWSVYREGNVPEGVVQIEQLDDFWDGISRLV